MPRKIKIINENVEEIESLEKTPEPPVKVKKPRTEKQIQAFNAMLEKKKQKTVEVPKEEVPEEVDEPVHVEAISEIPKRKRGRPQLTPEKLEMKQTMKEAELQKQLEKLEKKIEMTAKQEAKKKVLTKIKQKLEEDDDDGYNSYDSDDSAINQIVARQKKPIVIVNKIGNQPIKRKPRENNEPSAYFV